MGNENEEERLVDSTRSESAAEARRFPVVAVGVGAGGVAALGDLLRGHEARELSFVLICHSSIVHETARKAVPQAIDIAGGMAVERSRVYLAPQACDVALFHGVFHVLAPVAGSRAPRLPLDFFMRSLAADNGSASIGVVLAGTGTDGAFGLEAIKAEGGLTMVQDPGSAEIDLVPRRARPLSGADLVLAPEQIAAELAKLTEHPYIAAHRAKSILRAVPDSRETSDELAKLFLQIRTAFGTDLSLYKHSTIERRIERRMALHRIERLPDYVRFVQARPAELEILYKDCLIGVTSFFRDHGPFEALASSVFPRILEHKRPGAPIRIWVPGCSTGEEAYSIAICLLEFLDGRAPESRIQMFASDLDHDSIQRARQGIYPPNIAQDVSQTRLGRFFVRQDTEFRVARRIRDMIVFAHQDVTRDPPFSHVDLVSCRNLLIYLQTPLQKRVLRIFHYALNPDGILMLGSSETIGESADLFAVLDKQEKIYVRKNIPTANLSDISFGVSAPRAHEQPIRPAPDSRPAPSLQQIADRKVLERYGPPGVLVNENLDVLQFRGRVGMFLEPMPGTASLNLMKLVRPDLLIELRSAVEKAQGDSGQAEARNVTLRSGEAVRSLHIEVIPIHEPETRSRCFLILFEELEGAGEPPGPTIEPALTGVEARVRDLERELQATKEYLQTTVEELESANEELKSSNEELQSSNEELQSTNEELETSKEEVLSTNEELNTVNDELHSRMGELSIAHDDLQNLLGVTGDALVIVGMDLRIRRFTNAAEKLLKLVPADVGRAVSYLQAFVSGVGIEAAVRDSIDRISERQEEGVGSDDRWYQLRIIPYRTADHSIRGALLVFTDINARKRRLELSRHIDHNVVDVLDAVQGSLVVLDRDMRVLWANASYHERFHTSDNETLGNLLQNLGNGQWAHPKLRGLMARTLNDGESFRRYPVEHTFERIGRRTMLVSGSRLLDDKDVPLVLVAIEETADGGQRKPG